MADRLGEYMTDTKLDNGDESLERAIYATRESLPRIPLGKLYDPRYVERLEAENATLRAALERISRRANDGATALRFGHAVNTLRLIERDADAALGGTEGERDAAD